MKTESRPYEVVVRFDEAGAVRGAHVQWADVLLNDDGTVAKDPGGNTMLWRPGTAVPAGSGPSGFPLDKVVSDAIAVGLGIAAPKLAAYDALASTHHALVVKHSALHNEVLRIQKQLARPASVEAATPLSPID